MCQFTDRFYAAVRTLAGGGSLKQRLLSAYTDHLETLPKNGIPESIREGLERLQKSMCSATPIGREYVAAASIRKMSAAEAAQHAASIVAMFSELVRVKSTGEPLANIKRAEGKDAESSIPAHIALN